MKRREFIALLGSATAWPLAARAQQPAHTRRIGVLSPFAENDFRSAGQSDGVPASLVSLMAPIRFEVMAGGFLSGQNRGTNLKWHD
jgi:hypothetical protein